MLNMIKGCTVPFPEILYESYQIEENHISANINLDKMEEILQHFIVMHEEPQFFILELPTKLDDEKEIENGNVEFHEDTYYIDGCSQEQALTILMQFGNILINDGLCSFGFGCHESGDEILFGKYNVVTIFSHNITKYEAFFAQHNIPKVDHLLTAWNTFTPDHPGTSEVYKVNEQSVFDIPELFKDWGIYFCFRRSY